MSRMSSVAQDAANTSACGSHWGAAPWIIAGPAMNKGRLVGQGMIIKNSKKGMESSLSDRRHVQVGISSSRRERWHHFNDGGGLRRWPSPAETLRRGTVIKGVDDRQALPNAPRCRC